MSSSVVPRSDVSNVCQLRIERFLTRAAEIEGILVSTRDGFEVASCLGRKMVPAKLAAMSSSMLAVADALAQSGGVQACDNIVIEGEQGRILLVGIKSEQHDLMITAFCSPQASLGRALWSLRECSKEIAQALHAVERPS